MALVQAIHNLVMANGFDGFDFDWEYPGQRDGVSADKVNYITFLKELREKFGKNLLITAAVGATPAHIQSSYDVWNMNMYVENAILFIIVGKTKFERNSYEIFSLFS